ncbi:MAG: DUF2784 domain-containing protein [Terracidiphilus sp.]
MLRLAILMVAVHAAWLLLVIFGALWTRRRPVWSTIHVLALVWGIIVEVGPWPCPLSMAEEYFTARTSYAAYRSSHLLHFLNAIVYPNLPGGIVATAGVAVCAVNLGIYARRVTRAVLRRRRQS